MPTYNFYLALERYNKLRVKHTKKIVKRSRKIGKTAQRTNKFVVKTRNKIAKILPDRLLSNQTKFIYKSKAK